MVDLKRDKTDHKLPVEVSVPTLPGSPEQDHFIPLRAEDLARLLAGSVAGAEDHDGFLTLCRRLRSVFHLEYHGQLLGVKSAYAPFDPDSDTLRVEWHDAPSERPAVDSFFDQVIPLFERANFHRLNEHQLQRALERHSDWGLRLEVDFDVFERLEVFSRGTATVERTDRHWRNWFRRQSRPVQVYQRLVVAFRLRSGGRDESEPSDSVILKIFKDIPRGDLEMLLPGTKVRMTLLDRLRIALPTISGLVMTIIKIAKGAMMMAFAGIYGLLSFVGLVGGTIGYGVKSFFGYLRTKDKYQANLTKNLYYKNLDNNAGVLFRLLDEVEEQEFRETVIAYALLNWRAPASGWTMRELDDAAEELLYRATEQSIDFEADDALRKLLRLGLARQFGQRFFAVPLREAIARVNAATLCGLDAARAA